MRVQAPTKVALESVTSFNRDFDCRKEVHEAAHKEAETVRIADLGELETETAGFDGQADKVVADLQLTHAEDRLMFGDDGLTDEMVLALGALEKQVTYHVVIGQIQGILTDVREHALMGVLVKADDVCHLKLRVLVGYVQQEDGGVV